MDIVASYIIARTFWKRSSAKSLLTMNMVLEFLIRFTTGMGYHLRSMGY
jgi:hypothetical protein